MNFVSLLLNHVFYSVIVILFFVISVFAKKKCDLSSDVQEKLALHNSRIIKKKLL